ncbi:hypothetical protein EDB89DRAFT_996009 [Lactarius sanguifluus]|nr:hypothetical protein EDB89DRAFT_996009 [Lactarius sanguifluus]
MRRTGSNPFFFTGITAAEGGLAFCVCRSYRSRSISCPQPRENILKALLDEINLPCLTSRLNNDAVRRYSTRRGLVYLYHLSFSSVRLSNFTSYPSDSLMQFYCRGPPFRYMTSCDQPVRPHAFFFRTTAVALRCTCGLTVFPTRRMYIINASYDHCRPLVYSSNP